MKRLFMYSTRVEVKFWPALCAAIPSLDLVCRLVKCLCRPNSCSGSRPKKEKDSVEKEMPK